MAAVLACGAGAVLSGRPAGHLHRLIKGVPPRPEVTVTARRIVPGLSVRYARHLDPRDAGTSHGIPVTRIARTIVDLAALLAQPQLARAAHEAWVLHRVGAPEVEAVLARRPNSHGGATLRRVVHGDVHVTLSGLESRFLSLLASVGLPLPEMNTRLGGRTLDCRWPAHRLRRARRLPLPRVPPRLGARPCSRARGPRARRRLPPLHLWRRLRAPGSDARRTARGARVASPE